MSKIFLRFLVLFILLWVAGFSYFTYASLSAAPQHPEQKTDAIIVLTGGPKRIEEGLRLFSSGLSGQIFISGVHPSVSMDDIKNLKHGGPALPECCITLGQEARTTIQNARETKDWIEKNNVKTIRLVTANYHMPRALIEFRAALPNLEIIAHPVADQNLKFDHWYFWAVMLSEYHKSIFRKISVTLGLPTIEWVQP
jgi:uncharacterized SAM-binding protein YcdF (DUF218 family)